MDNYVLLYNFEDAGSTKFFEEQIHNEFWRHQMEEDNKFKYFGFAAGEHPGVVSKLQEIVNDIAIGTKDYVVLYCSGAEGADKIQQEMILGHSDLIETKVNKISYDAHRNSLTKLLDFDYVKAQSQPPEK